MGDYEKEYGEKYGNSPGPLYCPCCTEKVEMIEEVNQAHWVEAHVAFQEYNTWKGRRAIAKAKATAKKQRKRGDDIHGCQPKESVSAKFSSQFLDLADKRHPEEPLFASAKTREVLEIIGRWQNEAPDDKIIGMSIHGFWYLRLCTDVPALISATVFTQSVFSARILGRLLQDQEINFLYYFGSMTNDERTRSLETLRDIDNVKVIVSLPNFFIDSSHI